MYNLFLDDERLPHRVTWVNLPNGPWTVVRSYKEFCEYITKNGLPHFVSFDHDLADEHYRQSMYAKDGHYSNYYTDGTFKEKTGYDCLKYLISKCQDLNAPVPQCVFHTMNPIGKQNMENYLKNYLDSVQKR